MACESNSPALNQTKCLIRGDSRGFKFQRKNYQQEAITDTPETLFFTVKTSFKVVDYLFQKKLDNMWMTQDGYWHFKLNPQDTESLPYGKYCWDVQVVQNGFKTTIARGYLKLLDESTFKENE